MPAFAEPRAYGGAERGQLGTQHRPAGRWTGLGGGHSWWCRGLELRGGGVGSARTQAGVASAAACTQPVVALLGLRDLERTGERTPRGSGRGGGGLVSS